jgi:hypothetical protein
MDKYTEQVINTYKATGEIAWDLLLIAKRLCPGDWVLQVEPGIDHENNKQRVFHAMVSNGDDNVTGTGKSISSALAQLITYLLNGSVFPLTGNGGQYIHPLDRGFVKKE